MSSCRNVRTHASCSLFPAQAQYNAQKAGITSAIVLAVLIPIGILGFCLVLKLRQRAQEAREEDGYNMDNTVYRATTTNNYGGYDDNKGGKVYSDTSSDYGNEPRNAYDDDNPRTDPMRYAENFQQNDDSYDSASSPDTLRRKGSLGGMNRDPDARKSFPDPMLSPGKSSLPPPPMDLMARPPQMSSGSSSGGGGGRRGLAPRYDQDSSTDPRYEESYYTQEPLANRQPLAFPDKTLDVDIDLKSYKTHGNRI